MAKDQPYYFSHDVNASTDTKIVAMMSEHGTISYAWWWLLIEKLAISEDYKLPFKKYTFIALDKELGMNSENERPLNENERPLNENEQKKFCSNKSFLFVNSLISDFELLECDSEYFWSPSLVRRQEERKSKYEKKQEQRRLAGIKSGEARRKKEQNRTTVERPLDFVEQNEQKNIKEKNIKDIREREGTRATDIENPLSMFENEKQNNKAVYDLYMKSIGDISPVIKERLDDLVETYGSERVIVAVNTTAENGGNSIKYVETVAAGNLKKEVNQENGINKRGGGTRKAQTKTDGTEVDWSKETGEWI